MHSMFFVVVQTRVDDAIDLKEKSGEKLDLDEDFKDENFEDDDVDIIVYSDGL